MTDNPELISNIDAEWCVISSLLRDKDRLVADEIRTIITRDDFIDPLAAQCFVEFLAIHDKGKGADVGVLIARVKKTSPSLVSKTSIDDLRERMNQVPTSHHADHYADLVRDAALRRGIVKLCDENRRAALSPGTEARETLNRLTKSTDQLQQASTREEAISIQELGSRIFETLRVRAETKGQIGIPTGLANIDAISGGLPLRELIILAARPSVGKTSLGLQIACNVGSLGKSVFFVSLEMSKDDILDRIVSLRAGVPLHDLKSGDLKPGASAAIITALSVFNEWKFSMIEDKNSSVVDIASHAKRIQKRDGLDLIVIDYLTKIRSIEYHGIPHEQKVAEISNRLKVLACDCGVPVLCLAQLNRDKEKGERPPRLSDLRSSGAIEQDADQVWLLDRHPGAGEDRVTELNVAKNRNGPTGKTKLLFIPDHARFDQFTQPDPEQGRFV